LAEIGGSRTGYRIAIPGREDSPLVVSWAAISDTGRRRAANEDSFLAQSPLFVVADGMGGHSAGDLASAAVIGRLAEIATTDFLVPRAIERALEEATKDIGIIAIGSELGVGTTVTGAALTMQDDNVYFAVFNIGDSRVYAFEKNEFAQITRDHSVVQELVESGALSRDEAENHPDSNIITRAVGFNAAPTADFWMLPVSRGLRLLICSDGLTNEVSDERLRLHMAAGLSPVETVGALVDAALAAGGRDNVTAVIVEVVDAPGLLDIEDTSPRKIA
jgi:PPM family protein phosphatase